ncbi:hypothetical protein [Croceimicrobium sp.]|uniref:hypothetical protein n=1 Tax=Croceimicrobium sp. TaxID=2828340 RepID=UPI003BA85257
MKRLTFLSLVLLSALSLKAQEDSTEANMHLYVQAGGALAYTPLSNLNDFLNFKTSLRAANPSTMLGFSFRSDRLESTALFHRYVTAESDGESINISQATVRMAVPIDIGKRLQWVPGVDLQILTGRYEQLTADFSQLDPLPIGNVSQWNFEQMGLALNNELRWIFEDYHFAMAPDEIFMEANVGLPVGPGFFEYRNRHSYTNTRTPLFPYNWHILIGLRYKMKSFSLKKETEKSGLEPKA